LGVGLPIVASNTRWFKHLSDFIYLVDNEEEMAEIISGFMSSKEFWELSQSNCRKAVEQRGWSKVAATHVEMYKEIMNG
jgi:glycosyltransferase involved in cell wall biosynthesis